jgi:hypothetical protein
VRLVPTYQISQSVSLWCVLRLKSGVNGLMVGILPTLPLCFNLFCEDSMGASANLVPSQRASWVSGLESWLRNLFLHSCSTYTPCWWQGVLPPSQVRNLFFCQCFRWWGGFSIQIHSLFLQLNQV